MTQTDVFNLEIINLKQSCSKLEQRVEVMEKAITEIRIGVAKVVAIGATVTSILTPILVTLADKLWR